MRSQFEYGIPADAKEAQRLGAILEQCFNSPPNSSEAYFKRVGLENFRILRASGQLAGGLATLSMGQWFGNQRVPMVGIAAVGVAPEYRGSGAAIALMQQTLQDLYASDTPISVLYPAVQRLYRKAGYEQGGSYCTWEMSSGAIRAGERSLPIQAVETPRVDLFREISQQQAQINNGNLDRHAAIWEEILKPDSPETVYAYLLGEVGQPEGYLIFSQKRINNQTVLVVLDWTALTPAAKQCFWKFLADHRSQIDQVRWHGAAIDSLTLLLPEQSAKIHSLERWMLRIVNVTSALEMRGYPASVETELHLDIRDDLLPNSGKFVLSAAKGRGKVSKGGRGELKLDIRGLAPLYTGLFTAHQLQQLGQLEATERAIASATQLFAGSSPWLPDFF
jgi:predicted acetyltransferase